MNDLYKFATFHDVKVPFGAFAAIRIDGKSFHKAFAARKLKKPYDERIRDGMHRVVRAVMRGVGGVFAHTHGDEASILLPKDSNLYERRVERLISKAINVAALAMNDYIRHIGWKEWAMFLGGINVLPSDLEVREYFVGRFFRSEQNALNSFLYAAMLKSDTPMYKIKAVMERDYMFKNELLKSMHGTQLSDMEPWQLRGTCHIRTKEDEERRSEIYHCNTTSLPFFTDLLTQAIIGPSDDFMEKVRREQERREERREEGRKGQKDTGGENEAAE